MSAADTVPAVVTLTHAIEREQAGLAICQGDYGCKDDHLDQIAEYRHALAVFNDPNATDDDKRLALVTLHTARSAHGTGEQP